MLTFRPLDTETDDDFIMMAALIRSRFPDKNRSVEEHRFYFAHQKKMGKLFEIEMIERDGVVVGSGNYMHGGSTLPKYHINIVVHPDFARQGIAKAHYAHALKMLQSHKPAALLANTREDQPEALRFLAQCGFRRTMRDCRSRLDLTAFDAAKFAHIIERVEKSGIRFVTLTAFAKENPSWQRAMYDLNVTVLKDVPMPNPIAIYPFEMWVERLLHRPTILFDNWFVALDGDKAVGISNLFSVPNDPQAIEVGITGVLRSHRRRGICSALKVLTIESAKIYGAFEMNTVNEENNPMYQINLRLGFEPLPAWLSYEKAI